MDKLMYIIFGAIILLVLALSYRKSIKKISFKILSLFEGNIETRDQNSNGGRGGDVSVIGSNSTAIGGKGGAGGVGAKGGDGGAVNATGDNIFALGGEGGEAGQNDRGGRGGRGAFQVFAEDYPDKFNEIKGVLAAVGISEEKAKMFGKGGDGADPVS